MSIELYGTVDKKTAGILSEKMDFPEFEFDPGTGRVFLSLDCYDESEYSAEGILGLAADCLAKAGSASALVGKEIDGQITDWYVVTRNGVEYVDPEVYVERIRKEKEGDLMAQAVAEQGGGPAPA